MMRTLLFVVALAATLLGDSSYARADSDSDARAALALASMKTPSTCTSCACTSPEDCACGTLCSCPNCNATKVYKWIRFEDNREDSVLLLNTQTNWVEGEWTFCSKAFYALDHGSYTNKSRPIPIKPPADVSEVPKRNLRPSEVPQFLPLHYAPPPMMGVGMSIGRAGCST